MGHLGVTLSYFSVINNHCATCATVAELSILKGQTFFKCLYRMSVELMGHLGVTLSVN